MRVFGLIGYPLSHSFSKKYFSDKFDREGISNTSYQLFPLTSIDSLPELFDAQTSLCGLNVTIPYKQDVIHYLDELDPKAEAIGAVNTILLKEGKKIGYNTDYHGFKSSLVKFIGANTMPSEALILGTGGASKAIEAVLKDLNIAHRLVSRNPKEDQLSYTDMHDDFSILQKSRLVINTTPLGMAPDIDTLPDLPYDQLTEDHFVFDLVYNPLATKFMQQGIAKKCWVKNGLEMLHGQAEKAWEIWNK